MTDIRSLQQRIQEFAIERGHADNTDEEVLIRLLLETIEYNNEVCKLATAIMARLGMKVKEGVDIRPLKYEFADSWIMHNRIATVMNVDLNEAVEEKLEIDKSRNYVKVI